MSIRKVFIGSSQKSIAIAKAVAKELDKNERIRAKVWDEGAFTLNEGYLDRLLAIVKEYDFAVLIWAADDFVESNGMSRSSPRDNVLFESGLFMGTFGKDRAFILRDDRSDLKIPSDFAGVKLAYYKASRMDSDAISEARNACDEIAAEIDRERHIELVGEWRSKYALAGEPGHPEVVEDVEIVAAVRASQLKASKGRRVIRIPHTHAFLIIR